MPRVETRVPRGRRTSIRVVNLTDFTGGLNLGNEQFRLQENESPDLLNVDLGQRGGFRLRKVTEPLNSTGLADDPRSLWIYRNSSGTNQLMVNVGDTVLYSTGGNFTDCTIGAGSTTGPFRAATFNDLCYIQRYAEQVPVKWDGAADTSLTASGAGAWQDDLAAPAGGHMPKAKLIAAHGGFMWVANTVEDGTDFPNRLRWSHPNRPEDWREDDYVDVNVGADGDEIVALVPFKDHLLVFKKASTFAIFGYDTDSFQVVTVDAVRGTLHQDSVVASPMGVFFFHWPEGVYLYEGDKGGRFLFEKLFPAIRDGDIPSVARDEIMLGWGKGRLWVTVPWDVSNDREYTFVWDPLLGKTGGWTKFDLQSGPYAEWVTSTDTHYVGGYVGSDRVLKLEQSGTNDDYGAGDVDVESYFQTAWIDDGQPAVRKRFKRAEAVLHFHGSEIILPVRVYRDWDPVEWIKEFEFTLPDAASSVYGTAVFGVDEWSVPLGDQNLIDRGSNIGTARSVSLRFRPPADMNWGVEALILKYFPRTLRS